MKSPPNQATTESTTNVSYSHYRPFFFFLMFFCAFFLASSFQSTWATTDGYILTCTLDKSLSLLISTKIDQNLEPFKHTILYIKRIRETALNRPASKKPNSSSLIDRLHFVYFFTITTNSLIRTSRKLNINYPSQTFSCLVYLVSTLLCHVTLACHLHHHQMAWFLVWTRRSCLSSNKFNVFTPRTRD